MALPEHQPFLEELARALGADAFVKLVLARPRQSDAGARRATARVIELRGQPHLSLTFHEATRDRVENHPLPQAVQVIGALVAERFEHAHLFTTAADLELRESRRGRAIMSRRAPTFTEAPARQHDRARDYRIDPAAPFWRGLGLVGEGGRVRAERADKYRQVQHLIKDLDELLARAGLSSRPRLRLVDMGCGKGYLTFALHHHLTALGIEAEVLGIDRNPELVEGGNRLATELGATGLRFRCGSVEETDPGQPDVLLALHACDTATDEALGRGVAAGAALLVVVPCCQKEVRPQLVVPAEEAPLLRHDTFLDRYAQMVTDGLRALLLESAGYRTRVSEFISDEHTHRNVMLAAVLDPAAAAARAARAAEARALMVRYRISHQRLASLLAGRGRP